MILTLLLEVLNPLFDHMMDDIWGMTDIKEKLKKGHADPPIQNDRWCLPDKFIFEEFWSIS